MLFDKTHITFMIISFALIAVGQISAHALIKSQKYKDLILKISAILTVVLHYSSLYVDFLTTGTATIEDNMLFAVYPCNVTMWLLLIVAFKKNKSGKVFTTLADITFYLGIIGGVIGIVFNEIYGNTGTLADYDTLKGLLSHCTLIFGSIYLLVGGYIKIRVSNTISAFIGAVLLFVDGWFIIGIYTLCGLEPPNTMYLLESPFAGMEWFNSTVIGLAVILLVFAITAIYEQIALKKEDRWYSILKENLKNKEIKQWEIFS